MSLAATIALVIVALIALALVWRAVKAMIRLAIVVILLGVGAAIVGAWWYGWLEMPGQSNSNRPAAPTTSSPR